MPPLIRPASATAMALAFNRMSLQGFGGVLAVAQRELVERQRWLNREQFVELLSLSQVLPGPNIVNLGLIIGDRFFGWRGVVAALLGLLAVPLAIVLLLAAAYTQLSALPAVAGALRGMGAVAAGLVLATAARLAPTLQRNPMGWPLCALYGAITLLAVGGLRWPLAAVVLGLGLVAVATAWWKLAR